VVIKMKNEYESEKKISDSYFEFQAVMGMTKHMGGVKATEELAESCHIDKDRYVLDIGCGLGKTACHLAKKYGCRVTGVDISEKMVEQARKRAEKAGLEDKVEFRIGDAQDLPFEESSFDAVIGESVLAFVEDKPRALKEFIRVTKTEGYIGFNECTWIRKPPARLIQYISDVLGAVFLTPNGWQEIWEKPGLKDIIVRTYKVRILEQWGNEIRELDFKEYSGAWYGFFSLLFKSPECRKWARKTLSMPWNIFALLKYFGYGIYIGRK